MPIVDNLAILSLLVLLVDEDSEDLLGCSEEHLHLLDSQIGWQLASGLQRQIQLVKLLPGYKSGIQLEWDHIEVAIQAVLHYIGLAHLGEE